MPLRFLRPIARTILDFALLPRCPGYGQTGADPKLFCAPCWSSLEWLSGRCARCGLPLEAGATEACGRCLADPPPFDRIRSSIAYGPLPRALVTKLKYGRKVGIAATLGRYMVSHVDSHDALLVPVQLHRWRLWSRGFNQAVLLARARERERHGKVRVDLLRRARRTRPLKGMNASQRKRETSGAFKAVADRGELGRQRIILVDDVLTSGSTAEACARALRKAGAQHVELLTFARVVATAKAEGFGEERVVAVG